jgi:2-polyprenyl-3-methyl-5-hydroxy-6-metoxy-1,4-benzoquinol methylase
VSSTKVLEPEISLPPTERVYTNNGNGPLIDLLEGEYRRVLDIGCGAGDNAALVHARAPHCDIFGITQSASEASLARTHMADCWVFDIEAEFPRYLAGQTFDVLIFSHVLEHLRNPDTVLARFSELLRPGGQVLIAVPNVLFYRPRLKFLRGSFEYTSSGVMDDTHLHFYTYFTADRYLLAKSKDLKLTQKTVCGHVPLWMLRRHVFPQSLSRGISNWFIDHWPNFFGYQILLRAVKQGEREDSLHN